MNGILATARAVGTIASSDLVSQTTSALWTILMISFNLPLTEAWLKQLAEDQETYFKDTLEIGPTNPEEAAAAAGAYAKLTADTNAMSNATGYQDTIVQNLKGFDQEAGNAIGNVYNLELPIGQVLTSTSRLILTF